MRDTVVGLLLLGLSLQSTGQTPPTITRLGPKDLSDTKVYEALFRKALAYNAIADKMEAMGRKGDGPRSRIVAGARLSPVEAQCWASVITEWRDRIATLDGVALSLKRRYAELKASGNEDPATLRKLFELQKQRDGITDEEVGRLKTAFGPFRFFLFDQYVKRTSTVRAVAVTPSPSDSR